MARCAPSSCLVPGTSFCPPPSPPQVHLLDQLAGTEEDRWRDACSAFVFGNDLVADAAVYAVEWLAWSNQQQQPLLGTRDDESWQRVADSPAMIQLVLDSMQYSSEIPEVPWYLINRPLTVHGFTLSKGSLITYNWTSTGHRSAFSSPMAPAVERRGRFTKWPLHWDNLSVTSDLSRRRVGSGPAARLWVISLMESVWLDTRATALSAVDGLSLAKGEGEFSPARGTNFEQMITSFGGSVGRQGPR